MMKRADRMLLTSQVVLGIVALSAISLYPPTRGRILLVPLSAHGARAVARTAFAAGAALLGRGPVPGSWVVVGERARIATKVHGWDMLLLAAPPAGCGADARAVAA